MLTTDLKEIQESYKLRESAFEGIKNMLEYKYNVLKRIKDILPEMMKRMEIRVCSITEDIAHDIEKFQHLPDDLNIIDYISYFGEVACEIDMFKEVYYDIVRATFADGTDMSSEIIESELECIYADMIDNSQSV